MGGQLDGSNRPGQLGDTGIIVLNTCTPLEAKCNCAGLLMESISNKPTEKPRVSSFVPTRTPRRGRKFQNKNTKGSNKTKKKDEKVPEIKNKRKFKRIQRRLKVAVSPEEKEEITTTEKVEQLQKRFRKNRKFRIRKR